MLKIIYNVYYYFYYSFLKYCNYNNLNESLINNNENNSINYNLLDSIAIPVFKNTLTIDEYKEKKKLESDYNYHIFIDEHV